MTRAEFLSMGEVLSSPEEFYSAKHDLKLIPEELDDLMIAILLIGSNIETVLNLDRSMKSKLANKYFRGFDALNFQDQIKAYTRT